MGSHVPARSFVPRGLALELRRLSFAYGDAVPLLDAVDLHLTPGWHGLIGDNGSGKSTLLGLIAGRLAPTSGAVLVRGGAERVVAVPQEVEAPTAEVEHLASSTDGEARALRDVLALTRVEPWATLSPGERRRWLIGAALSEAPDVLLLDEPESHLDLAGRDLLVAALARFRGVGLIVSHDRALLDAVTSRTLVLAQAKLRLLEGGASEALAVLEREREAALTQRRELRDRVLARAQTREQTRAVAARASASTSASSRMKGPRDHDGRSMGRKVTAGWAASTHARAARRADDALEAARAELEASRVEDRLGAPIAFRASTCPRAHVLIFETSRLVAGERVLLEDVRLALGRGDKVHLAGPNGAGKTTLLRAMLAASTLPPERLLVLPQVLDEAVIDVLLAELRAAPRELRGRTLQLVAALGTDPDRLLASERPSAGEARKLALAFGLAREVWALVLDEPDNHLDLGAITRLEAALAGWPGALLLVTHDAHLAAAVTTIRWTLRPELRRVEVGPVV